MQQEVLENGIKSITSNLERFEGNSGPKQIPTDITTVISNLGCNVFPKMGRKSSSL
jgi:hypothetical protein